VLFFFPRGLVIHNFGHCDDVLMMVYSCFSLELSPEKSYLYLFPEITVLKKVRRLPIHFACENARFSQAALSQGARSSHCA
jgi:hypothetical protein